MSARQSTRLKSIFSQLEVTSLSQPNESSCSPPKKSKRLTRSSSFGGSVNASKAVVKLSDRIDLTLDEDEGVERKYNRNENWIESFAPTNVDDLAIHPKKLVEIQNWFSHCEAVRKKFPAQICLLTGPSGCGKTATVKVCASTNNYDVQEWINPVDQEVVTSLGDQRNGDGYMGSQVEAFKSFLLRASRYKSLFSKNNKILLLVEDFPNVLIKDPSTFEDILAEYIIYGKAPLVFVVADSKTKGLNISYNLFNDQLKIKCRIEHISLNPIANTLMQKSMKRFISIMQNEHAILYKVPPQNIVDSILLSSQGDIRNALINLHFASLKGAPQLSIAAIEKSKEKTKRKKKESTLKSVGRDESITMMHALGRVFNPKYADNGELTHKPEEIAEHFRTEPRKFTDFIHANYLPHFKDVGHVVKAIDSLTLSDMMLNEYRNEVTNLLGLNLAVRSQMVHNATPVSAWLPVHGPKRITTPIRPSGKETTLLGPNSNVIMKTYATDYESYLKIISKQSLKSS